MARGNYVTSKSYKRMPILMRRSGKTFCNIPHRSNYAICSGFLWQNINSALVLGVEQSSQLQIFRIHKNCASCPEGEVWISREVLLQRRKCVCPLGQGSSNSGTRTWWSSDAFFFSWKNISMLWHLKTASSLGSVALDMYPTIIQEITSLQMEKWPPYKPLQRRSMLMF